MFWSSATVVCKRAFERIDPRGTQRTKKHREKQASDGWVETTILCCRYTIYAQKEKDELWAGHVAAFVFIPMNFYSHFTLLNISTYGINDTDFDGAVLSNFCMFCMCFIP